MRLSKLHTQKYTLKRGLGRQAHAYTIRQSRVYHATVNFKLHLPIWVNTYESEVTSANSLRSEGDCLIRETAYSVSLIMMHKRRVAMGDPMAWNWSIKNLWSFK
jgi:hypothetical protein